MSDVVIGPMEIGILQTGRAPDTLAAQHGDYDEMFKQLLAGRGFGFTTYAVLDGVFPEDIDAADGWLITGSKHGVYEGHAWIPPLEDFIRAAYAQAIPLVGVCFGHQIMAQALGGSVEKFAGGWSVGAVDYQLPGNPDPMRLLAWHQDQVVSLPADAEVIGSTDFCPYAMLAYGDQALSVQPHPEFTEPFLQGLLKTRGKVLPLAAYQQAEQSLGQALYSEAMADRFEAFFKRGA